MCVWLLAVCMRQHDSEVISYQDEWKLIFLMKQAQQHNNINTRMFIAFLNAQHVPSWNTNYLNTFSSNAGSMEPL